jgi:TetR/AcrR family transcriptional repressor of nem operon
MEVTMKVSKAKMAENRERIIKAAAKRFRERGFDGIGVAELMKEVGLTHGGFYGHFKSKAELVELATQLALEESREKWERVIESTDGDPLKALAEWYLSSRHRDAPGTGCFFAAVGADMAREPASTRNATDVPLERSIDLISRIASGGSPRVRRKRAIKALATMVGGMVLARTVGDRVLSEEILDTLAALVPLSEN